jgi:hypothetical protein
MVKMAVCVSFLSLLVSGCKPQIQRGDAVALESRPVGIFSVLDDVWGLVDCFETNFCSAIKIDFGKEGLYYDSKMGPNWFEYYFQPIHLGTFKGHVLRVEHPFENGVAHPEWNALSRKKIGALVHKYIKLRPALEHEVQKFVDKNFKSHFMIGIHYRGTDKASEAPRTNYERVADEIRYQAYLKKLVEFKIFVATDEHGFLEYLKEQFPNQVIELPGVQRSKDGKPLHLSEEKSHYEMGKAAILDSVLLSKTNLLIRTSSNLSRWSTYFNPELEVIELSNRY